MEYPDSAARTLLGAPSFLRQARACFAALAIVSGLGPTLVAAQTAPAQKAAPNKTPVKNNASLEARHAKCMAFIKDHGLECDPWQTPTCGYDLAIMRPLECARPY